jgi:hypothetical protein
MQYGELSASDLVAIVTTALAAISFLFNWMVVQRQEAMQREALRMHLDGWIVEWGRRSLDAIAKAISFAEQGKLAAETAVEERQELRSRIAARVDEGRFFFANTNAEGYASSAEPEKDRGHRQPVLDALVFIEKLLVDPRSNALNQADVVAFMKHCNGMFYTQVQWSLDPRARRKMLRRLERNVEEAREVQERLARRLEAMLPGTLKRFGTAS